jgi:hypothetical protein
MSRKKEKQTKKCNVCQNEFKAYTSRIVYCNRTCASIGYKKVAKIHNDKSRDLKFLELSNLDLCIKGELWVDVIGYEGYYMISNMGRVKTLRREITDFRNGKNSTRIRREKIMTPVNQKSHPYFSIQLKINKKFKGFMIHRLVAIHFIPNPVNKPEVNHIDGNQKNNHFLNLEWVTGKENCQHAWRIGLAKSRKGEQVNTSFLKTADVLDIRNRVLNGEKTSEIAKRYNTSSVNVRGIHNRITWKHI